MITATDIRQYIFCPRTVYLNHVLHIPSRSSQKMKKGRAIHDKIEKIEKIGEIELGSGLQKGPGTRGSVIFRNEELDGNAAERRFSLPLESRSLGLRGVLDLLVVTGSGRETKTEMIPVDFKFGRSYSGSVHKSHKFQLAAYALLVEENFRTVVRRGYVFYIPENASVRVDFKDDLKNNPKNDLKSSALQMIREITEMIRKETEPERAENPAKCGDCSYRRFCEGKRA
jgi:CRISPR-associated exonuclease Cas4